MTKTAVVVAGMEEQKAQVTDTALYDEEHKKGPRDVNDVSWAVGKFFLVHVIFWLLMKFLDINY